MKPVIIALFLVVMASATVPPAPPSSATFTCTGSVGPYPFTFPITDPTAMSVYQNGTLVVSANYTITTVNNNYNNGGNVTLSVACPSGQVLLLQRITPQTQTTKFYDNMPIPMSTLEKGLDKLTEIDQEIWAYGVMHWKGAWSSTVIYTLSDAVSYNGSSYISLTYFNLNNTPGTAPTQWSLMVAGGSQFVGPISGVTVGYPVAAAGQFTVVNGVINPLTYSGSDVGAQINTAISSNSCSDTNPCHVVLPPSPQLSFSTTISIPGATTLECTEAGESAKQAASQPPTLKYTGSGIAVQETGARAVFRGCGLDVGNATTGIVLTGANSRVEYVYTIGGVVGSKVLHMTGSDNLSINQFSSFDAKGDVVYADTNVYDGQMTNVVVYTYSPGGVENSTARALVLDSGVSGMHITNFGGGYSGLHGMVLQNTLTGNPPTQLFFKDVTFDCTYGDAVLFDSTLGTYPIEAHFDQLWAVGGACGLTTFTATANDVHISGGRQLYFNGGWFRDGANNGFLIDNTNVGDVHITNSMVQLNNVNNGNTAPNGSGVYASVLIDSLEVAGNQCGDRFENFAGTYQNYCVALSASGGNDILIHDNIGYANNVSMFTYPVAGLTGQSAIYANLNQGKPVNENVMVGPIGATSTGGGAIAAWLSPAYFPALKIGLGINCHYDELVGKFVCRTDLTNNGGSMLLGTQMGAGGLYSIPTNTPASDQQIAAGSLPTPSFSWDSAGNVAIGGGTNAVYRCVTAGTLPIGALTITVGNCGTTADTGLRVK